MNMFTNAKIRRPLIRCVLILLWIGLGVVIFFAYRGHTLLVDNQDIGNYKAVEVMNVTIDKQDDEEIWKGDRIRFTVSGAKHKILVEFMDGRQPVEYEFNLPVKEDMYILSVPKMLAEQEFVEPFRIADQVREAADEAAANEFESFGP